jgi:hypothetical protein
MSWLNPVAFIGLLALAVPILVHLFGRPAARRQRFPSLRLLRFAQPSPATRSRPSDLLLLVLRCLTILAAVAALAQPRMSGTRAPARVIMIDTSASMLRLTSDGSSAVQQARSIARRMVDSSSESLLLESDHPGANVAGAGSWLTKQGGGGVRELVVISDFQAGTVDEGQFAALPAGIGTRLVRVQAAGPLASTDTVDGVTVEPAADRTSATWSAPSDDSLPSVTVLAAEKDRDAVRASMTAVRTLVPHTSAKVRRVTVVFPGARDVAGEVVPFDSAWQGDLALSLARDPTLELLSQPASVVPSCETRGAVVARNAQDMVVASIARGAQGVIVFACVEPGTLAGTALLASVESALRLRPPVQELEPNFVPDEILRRWEWPAFESAPHGPGETSPDGRWFWVVSIAFLLAEEWVRRRTPRRETARVNEVPHERVA